MRDGVAVRVLRFGEGGERRGQRTGTLLVFQHLAVLERQIDKQALHRQSVAVISALHRQFRRFERQRIGGEGVRRAAKHVARELVEHQDARKPLASAVEPFAPVG